VAAYRLSVRAGNPLSERKLAQMFGRSSRRWALARLLLPCNVVVRATPAGTVVEALDPQIMATLTGRPELKPVADEAARRLATALAGLKEDGEE
jgi:hypothetical protein